jgi:hypothetical protein
MANRGAGSGFISFSPFAWNVSTYNGIKDNNDKIAFRFFIDSTSSVTINSADAYISNTGVMTGITMIMDIETESAGAPSGTLVGGATSAFANAATGWTGQQAFSSSATLNPNTPYWLVFSDGGGTAPDGTHFYGPGYIGSNGTFSPIGGIAMWNQTGTWGSAQTNSGRFVLQDSNGNYYGCGLSSGFGSSAITETKVFGTLRSGLRFKINGNIILSGVGFLLYKTSSPGSLEVSLYKEATLLETVTIAANQIIGTRIIPVSWASSYTMTPNTNYTIYIHQASDGGDSSNYYTMSNGQHHASYKEVTYPATWYLVSGTSADPSGWSTKANYMPGIFPIMKNLDTDYAPVSNGGFMISGGN